jgi:hypothetical protein
VDVDRHDVVEIGQLQFRHFVIPGRHLAAKNACPGFASGLPQRFRKR